MYCYVYDRYGDDSKFKGPRYTVNVDKTGAVLAEFDDYTVAMWFRAAVNSAYALAIDLDQRLRKASVRE